MQVYVYTKLVLSVIYDITVTNSTTIITTVITTSIAEHHSG